MIDKLKELNEKLIQKYSFDEEKLKKQLLIKKMLNEKKCFFKMSIEVAYSILIDLGIPNSDLKIVYSELIDAKNYEE